MALISEPGKGMFWIRPGDMLGYYIEVTQIRREAVVCAFKDHVGQVAWEPSSKTVSQRPRPDASSHLPPVTASPLSSRLGTPKQPAIPRPLKVEDETKDTAHISLRKRKQEPPFPMYNGINPSSHSATAC